MKVDLNCDMGEGFGRYTLGVDEALMGQITSANIACAWHAGDPLVMNQTVKRAKQWGVNVGAHPGHYDLQGFGRRVIELTPEEAELFVLYQLGALYAIAKANAVELVHVKPHGALYNQASANEALAHSVATAIARFSRNLILVGLAGSALIQAAKQVGLPVANEAFPDRAYNADGTLMPRNVPGTLITSVEAVAANAVRLVNEGVGGTPIDTLCVHSDTTHAVEMAQAVRNALLANGVTVERMRAY